MSSPTRRRLLRSGLALAGLGLLTGCALTPPSSVRPSGPRRIGYLEIGTNSRRFEPFRAELRELGYREGENLTIEYREAQGDLERVPGLLAELAGRQVELIAVSTTPPRQLEAYLANGKVPLVAVGGDLVGSGLVRNVAHPGGLITGPSSATVELVPKVVELLAESVPGLRRLAAVADPAGNPAFRQALERAAATLRLELRVYGLGDLDRTSEVYGAVKQDRAEALVVLTGGVLGAGNHPWLAQEALRQGLPAAAQARIFAANGGLLAVGVQDEEFARRAAGLADRILKGARAGDLPVELPTRIETVVNVATAQALGLTIPSAVLTQATEVIR